MSPSASVAVSVMPTVAGTESSTHSWSALYRRSVGNVAMGLLQGRGLLLRTTEERIGHHTERFGATAHVDTELGALRAALGGRVRERDRVAERGRGGARGDGAYPDPTRLGRGARGAARAGRPPAQTPPPG